MTLSEVIKANPTGFTLDLEAEKLVNHNTGYYVGLTDFSTDTEDDFSKLVKAYYFVIKACGRKAYLGGWSPMTPTNNKYFLDISVHVDSFADAVKLGEMFNQNSIFDCKSGNVIDIK